MPLFEILIEATNIAGCYPVDERHSGLLLEVWFTFQMEANEIWDCDNEKGVHYSDQVCKRYLHCFVNKVCAQVYLFVKMLSRLGFLLTLCIGCHVAF